MYDLNKRQYIFRISNGRTINIFSKENLYIYTSFLGKRNQWTESTLLTKDSFESFSADMDEYDNIYILFQDKHGNIIRGHYNSGSLNLKTILSSKNETCYNKHLQVLCTDDAIFYFYVLEYSGNKLLSYQIQNKSGVLSTPKVIDYVSDSQEPYKAIINSKKELLIFYKTWDGKDSNIGFKRYNNSKEKWDEFNIVIEHTREYEIFALTNDIRQNLHLCCQKKNQDSYDLIYLFKVFDANTWTEPKVLSTARQPFDKGSIVSLNSLQLIYWINDNNIYYISKSSGTDSWSKREKYSFYEPKPYYCVAYKSNCDDKKSDMFFSDLPCNFIGGYKLGFIYDEEIKSPVPNINEARLMLIDDMRLLSKNMEDIKQSIKEIYTKIEELHFNQAQMDMDLSKISIKSSLMDNDILKLKSKTDTLINNFKEEKSDSSAPDSRFKNRSNREPKSDETQDFTGAEEKPDIKKEPEIKNTPVMPGTGFSFVTSEYLESLKKNKN